MGRLAEVEHEDFVRDRPAQSHGQVVFAFDKLPRADDRLHRDDLRILVGHLDADRPLARHGRDDAYTERRKVQRNVVLEVADLGDAHALRRHDLVERNGRPHCRLDRRDTDAEVFECLLDALLILALLLHVDRLVVAVVLLEQVERRKVIVRQVEPRIVFAQLGHHLGGRGGLFLTRHFDGEDGRSFHRLRLPTAIRHDWRRRYLVLVVLAQRIALIFHRGALAPRRRGRLRVCFLIIGRGRRLRRLRLARRFCLSLRLATGAPSLATALPPLAHQAPSAHQLSLHERYHQATRKDSDQDGRDEEQQHRARHPQIARKHLCQIPPVPPAGVEKRRPHGRCEGQREEDGRPDHHRAAQQESLQQRHPADAHQPQPRRTQEEEHEERRHAEPAIHHRLSHVRPAHARPVFHPGMIRRQFAQRYALHHALIRPAREKERRHGDTQIHHHEAHDKPREKPHPLARKKRTQRVLPRAVRPASLSLFTCLFSHIIRVMPAPGPV